MNMVLGNYELKIPKNVQTVASVRDDAMSGYMHIARFCFDTGVIIDDSGWEEVGAKCTCLLL